MIDKADELKEYWLNNPKVVRMSVTLLDGTAFDIDESEIVSLGLDRSVVSGEDVELASCMASELNFTLWNEDGKYSDYDFGGAEVFLRIGTLCETLQIDAAQVDVALVDYGIVGSSDQYDYISMGYYTVDSQPKTRAQIEITALDRMAQFDKEIDLAAVRTWFPTNPVTLITYICNACDIIVGSVDGVNLSAPLELPEELAESTEDVEEYLDDYEESYTYRELLSWTLAAIGSCGYINSAGRFCAKWYTEQTGFELDETYRFSGEVDRPLTITGLKTADNLFGGEEDPIDASDSPLVNGLDAEAQQNIADRISISYYPFNASILSALWLEPFDVIDYVENGIAKRSIITSWTYNLNLSFTVGAVGDPDTGTGYAAINPLTAQERKLIDKLKMQIAAAQADWQGTMDEFNNLYSTRVLDVSKLVANSLGLYVTNIEMDDGSIKIYYHDEPELENSSNVFTMNDNVFAWTDSYDGDDTVWSSSIEYGGNALFRYISAIGLTLSDPNSVFSTSITPNTFIIQCNGQTVLYLDNEGLTSTHVAAKQFELLNGSAKQWAIRKGATVSGTGVGLDIVWIGG